MNLVSMEYVAAQHYKHLGDRNAKPGILILPDNIGAAQYLPGVPGPRKSSAHLSAVSDARQTAAEIEAALQTNGVARMQMLGNAWKFVRANTAQIWASKFVTELQKSLSSGKRMYS